MNADELIDNVARQMTTRPGRPTVQARVMATIGGARQQPARGWLLPAATSAAVAVVALMWFVMPSRPVGDQTPIAQQTPAIATTPAVAEPTTVDVASTATATARVRAAAETETVAVNAWIDDELPADLPTLPPLDGPQPIVITPVALNDVTIAPLEAAITPLVVELLEVKALAIEPLAPHGDSGA